MVEKTWVISAFHKAISTAMVRNTETTDVPVTALVGASELLKEQEPVKPIRLENWWRCPSCSGNIVTNMKYCPNCGRPVEWDE